MMLGSGVRSDRVPELSLYPLHLDRRVTDSRTDTYKRAMWCRVRRYMFGRWHLKWFLLLLLFFMGCFFYLQSENSQINAPGKRRLVVHPAKPYKSPLPRKLSKKITLKSGPNESKAKSIVHKNETKNIALKNVTAPDTHKILKNTVLETGKKNKNSLSIANRSNKSQEKSGNDSNSSDDELRTEDSVNESIKSLKFKDARGPQSLIQRRQFTFQPSSNLSPLLPFAPEAGAHQTHSRNSGIVPFRWPKPDDVIQHRYEGKYVPSQLAESKVKFPGPAVNSLSTGKTVSDNKSSLMSESNHQTQSEAVHLDGGDKTKQTEKVKQNPGNRGAIQTDIVFSDLVRKSQPLIKSPNIRRTSLSSEEDQKQIQTIFTDLKKI